MSLRKSPRRSPQLTQTARSNSRRSTGPRSPNGKQVAKMNATKHGERSDPENHFQVMRALGEDPQEFEKLKRELMDSFGPGDALWHKQIDDLARLYWRRDRVERTQNGLMCRARLRVEEWQRTRQKQIAAVSFDSSQSWVIDQFSTSTSHEVGVRLRTQLSLLGVARVEVRQRVFKERMECLLRPYYQHQPGWRAARLRYLLWVFTYCATLEDQLLSPHTLPLENERALADLKKYKGDAAAYEAEYQELLRPLDEEIAEVREEFEHEEEVQAESAAIEREVCLAPEGEQKKMLLRKEETLDRAIDRKIKLLLSLRKEASRSSPAESGGGAGDLAVADDADNLTGIAVAPQKTNERSRNVIENTGGRRDAIRRGELETGKIGPTTEYTVAMEDSLGIPSASPLAPVVRV